MSRKKWKREKLTFFWPCATEAVKSRNFSPPHKPDRLWGEIQISRRARVTEESNSSSVTSFVNELLYRAAYFRCWYSKLFLMTCDDRRKIPPDSRPLPQRSPGKAVFCKKKRRQIKGISQVKATTSSFSTLEQRLQNHFHDSRTCYGENGTPAKDAAPPAGLVLDSRTGVFL